MALCNSIAAKVRPVASCNRAILKAMVVACLICSNPFSRWTATASVAEACTAEGSTFSSMGSKSSTISRIEVLPSSTRMASTLKEAVRYQVYVSSFRKKKSFLEILTPKQALLYKKWLLSNRERCNQSLDERRKKFAGSSVESVAPGTPGGDSNLTLEDLCRNLEEMLMISKVNEPSSSTQPPQA